MNACPARQPKHPGTLQEPGCVHSCSSGTWEMLSLDLDLILLTCLASPFRNWPACVWQGLPVLLESQMNVTQLQRSDHCQQMCRSLAAVAFPPEGRRPMVPAGHRCQPGSAAAGRRGPGPTSGKSAWARPLQGAGFPVMAQSPIRWFEVNLTPGDAHAGIWRFLSLLLRSPSLPSDTWTLGRDSADCL